MRISIQSFASASPRDVERGLLGWLTIAFGRTLILQGVALRRTLAGALTLSFPERTDASGRRRPIVRPLDDAARREIEAQVFEALGREALP